MEEIFVSPVYRIKSIPIEKIRANTYNPNVGGKPELKLLKRSIIEDGYTMPIVCYYIKSKDQYEIVDGFHRYLVMKTTPLIYEREKGHLPVSIIDRPLKNRMASTIRHNRARGNQSVELMTELVQKLTVEGVSDRWMMLNLGMSKEELLRLKQVNGLASLFKNSNFSRSWEMREEND